LRKLAKSELETGKELSSVEKVVLGRKFYNSSWISAGYKELVQKSDTITDDEAISIELSTAINLFRIREIMLRQTLTSALRAVEDVFSEELSTIHDQEIRYSTEQEKALVKEDEMRRRESEEQAILQAIAQAEEEEKRLAVEEERRESVFGSSFAPQSFFASFSPPPPPASPPSSPFASFLPQPPPASPPPPSPRASASRRKMKR